MNFVLKPKRPNFDFVLLIVIFLGLFGSSVTAKIKKTKKLKNQKKTKK